MSITRQSQANQGPRNPGKYNPWGARTTFQYVLDCRNPDSTALESLTGIHFPRPCAIFECQSFGKAWEKLGKSFGKALEKLCKSFAKALEKLWKSFEKALQKLWKSFEKALQQLCKGFAKAVISGSSRDPLPRPQGSRVCDPVSKKVENTPTQICPLGTSEQQICEFLFETFPHENTGRRVFKDSARARARTGPRASRAQNQGRRAQIAPFCTFGTFCIFGTRC